MWRVCIWTVFLWCCDLSHLKSECTQMDVKRHFSVTLQLHSSVWLSCGDHATQPDLPSPPSWTPYMSSSPNQWRSTTLLSPFLKMWRTGEDAHKDLWDCWVHPHPLYTTTVHGADDWLRVVPRHTLKVSVTAHTLATAGYSLCELMDWEKNQW